MTVHEWLLSLKTGDVINLAGHNVTLHEMRYYTNPPAGYPAQYRNLQNCKVQELGGQVIKLICRCCKR